MKKVFYITLSLILFASIFLYFPKATIYANDELPQPEVVLQNVDEYQNMSIYADETLLCSSLGKVLDVKNNTTFQNDDIEEGIVSPKFAQKTDNCFVIFDSLDRIQIYNLNFEYQHTLRYVDCNLPYNLGNIISVTKDYSGNLYFLDITNQKVLTVKNDYLKIEEVDLTLTFEILNTAKKGCAHFKEITNAAKEHDYRLNYKRLKKDQDILTVTRGGSLRFLRETDFWSIEKMDNVDNNVSQEI